jgi:hypothetical protein
VRPFCSSFRRKPESSDFAFVFVSIESQSFHSLRERVTFFARAKEVTKESTLRRFDGVFAEATSLCLRTAHFLCAVGRFSLGNGLNASFS